MTAYSRAVTTESTIAKKVDRASTLPNEKNGSNHTGTSIIPIQRNAIPPAQMSFEPLNPEIVRKTKKRRKELEPEPPSLEKRAQKPTETGNGKNEKLNQVPAKMHKIAPSREDKVTTVIGELERVFVQHADAALGKKQSQWLKGQVSCLGISTPNRRKLQKGIFAVYFPPRMTLTSSELTTLITALWDKPQRDFHHAAIDIAKRFSQVFSVPMIDTFKHMIKTHSWWDTNDEIGKHLVGSLVKQSPELLTLMDEWASDQNRWLRRTALIFQLTWKEDTDQERLKKYCLQLGRDKDKFVQKAVGWALREYGKTNPSFVQELLQNQASSFCDMSMKEASKHL